MMLKLKELKLEHLQAFDAKDDSFLEDLKFCLEHPLFRQCFSIWSEERVVGVIGASLISKGVWEGWFYPCKDIKKYSKMIVREVKSFSDWGSQNWDIHRLQIAVTEENKKWAQAIGFHFEGIVKNYHSNNDHYMFVKVRDYGR